MRSFESYFYAGHEDGTCHECNGSDIHCRTCGGAGSFEDARQIELYSEFEVIFTVQSAEGLMGHVA